MELLRTDLLSGVLHMMNLMLCPCVLGSTHPLQCLCACLQIAKSSFVRHLYQTVNVIDCCSRDKPEDLGFPPVEPAAAKPKSDKAKPNVLKQLVNTVLKNPFIWGMALTYFFIYIVRQVCTGRVWNQ